MPSKKSRGFTLMELLIAVAIFSGLVILALGSFARSLSSSAKVSSVRERTEVTRSIVNQISNDLRYAVKGSVTIGTRTAFSGGFIIGTAASTNSLELVLKYPDNDIPVHKLYKLREIGTTNPRKTIYMYEERGSCITVNFNTTCSEFAANNVGSDLLPEKYKVLEPTGGSQIFSGNAPTVSLRGLVTVDLTFTLSDSGVTTITDCTNKGIGGRCYSLKTSVVPGGY